MPKQKQTLKDWWLKRLKELKGTESVSADMLYTQLPDTLKSVIEERPWQYWTLFKLAIHAYYLRIYTNVIKSSFHKVAYIDTFSGAGLIRAGKKRAHYFLGSPLLSILHPQKMFDKFIFIDSDRKNIEVLTFFLNSLAKSGYVSTNSYQVINADMNTVSYQNLLTDVKHSLIFVDPDGLEPHFSTIKSLSTLPSDLVINYMDSGIKRVFGAKETEVNRQVLEKFFGKDVSDVSDAGQLLKIYVERLEKLDNRITKVIAVKGLGSFEYKIIFSVRRTKKGNPWFNALDDLKKRVGRTDKRIFDAILQEFVGEQASLDEV